MRAVVCQHAELDVREVPDPEPGPGQVLLEVARCGICGSDLHAREGMDEWAEMVAKVGYERFARRDDPVVFGHEFSGRVAGYGPDTRRDSEEGELVVALPLVRGPDGIDSTGLSPHAPGAYAERVVVQESMMTAVPNGLAEDIATLTEPMAVALHAVRRGEVGRGDVAIVIGCGPIGLGVILMLKARGVANVVASDPSAARRRLAERCGADIVIDPTVNSPYEDRAGKGWLLDLPSAFGLAIDVREKLERLPVGWWHAWRLGEKLGQAPKRPVIFECVGVPGMIGSVLDEAPLYSRVVVVGVCVGTDHFTPAMAINKEIDLRFVLAYTPLEYRDTLMMLAEGKCDPAPLITGHVGLDGVANAFDVLGAAEDHAKILIDPRSDAAAPAPA
ncbi:zinc-binding dehydrogenase [Thermoleophilia bacterium SCSIO 60948]|nr:zinc-binding dehydrogenase [Thermoleophilia bacterium SCSIO 60948]